MYKKNPILLKLFRNLRADDFQMKATVPAGGIKVTADLVGGSKSSKIVGLTSSLADEGKSTISASLEQLCAHSGARVILVDCDLRKRSLSHDLAPNATAGIIDVITEAASLDEVVWSDLSTKLLFFTDRYKIPSDSHKGGSRLGCYETAVPASTG